jgi:hypothetical protein
MAQGVQSTATLAKTACVDKALGGAFPCQTHRFPDNAAPFPAAG